MFKVTIRYLIITVIDMTIIDLAGEILFLMQPCHSPTGYRKISYVSGKDFRMLPLPKKLPMALAVELMGACRKPIMPSCCS